MNFNDVRTKINSAVMEHDKIVTARSRKHPNSHIWEVITTYPIYRSVIEPLLTALDNDNDLAYDVKYEKMDNKPGEGVQYRYKIQLRLATMEPDDVEGWE